MRLFVAVNFDEPLKDIMTACIARFKRCSESGRFTRRDNLHLTLAFIGETERADAVERAIDTITAPPFELKFGGLGRFRQAGGDLYWIGAERSGALESVHQMVCNSLRAEGLRIEDRRFEPHLTIGREVSLSSGFDRKAYEESIPEMKMKVGRISLMKSERINGKLAYTEIYGKNLTNAQ